MTFVVWVPTKADANPDCNHILCFCPEMDDRIYLVTCLSPITQGTAQRSDVAGRQGI